MNIQPLFNRLLVKRDDTQEMTAGGIVIPENAKEKPYEGTVLSVGSGKVLENGAVLPMTVKVGDRVMFSKYVGTEMETPDGSLLVLFEDDVLAIVRPEIN